MSDISSSEFYMWRAIFALAHADDVLQSQEITFLAEVLEDINFSEEQQSVLREDIYSAKDVKDMFKHVTDQRDQARFFKYARELVWIDGDYDEQEKAIMLELERIHIKSVDVDALVGTTDLQFELDGENFRATPRTAPQGGSDMKAKVHAFRERFLKDQGDDR